MVQELVKPPPPPQSSLGKTDWRALWQQKGYVLPFIPPPPPDSHPHSKAAPVLPAACALSVPAPRQGGPCSNLRPLLGPLCTRPGPSLGALGEARVPEREPPGRPQDSGPLSGGALLG